MRTRSLASGRQVGPPVGYKQLWRDPFTSFSRRTPATGGVTYREQDLDDGAGYWSDGPYYADQYGNAGIGREYWVRGSYPFGGTFVDPLSITANGLSNKVYPTPASVSSASGTTQLYISGFMTTRNFLLMKPPFYWRVVAMLAPGGGVISAPVFTIVRPPGWLDGNRARTEIDHPEGVGDFASTTTQAFLWNAANGAGQPYNSSVGNVVYDGNLQSGFHVYEVWARETQIIFKVDGRVTRTYDIPSTAMWLNRYYPLVSCLELDNGSLFGTDYTGTPANPEMLIRDIQVWVPNAARNNYEYIMMPGDGLGVDLCKDRPNATTFSTSSWSWYDQVATFTNGTAWADLDETVPAVVASAGATWHGREGYGNASGSNGVTSGQTYKVIFQFQYGTSNSGFFMIQPIGGGNSVNITASGNTPTVTAGTATNVSITDSPFGFKELAFDWAPGFTGDLNLRCGPNSATSGQTIIFGRCRVRKY